ncbi:hypothetical protein Trydic_g16744 [Trypoxylus dichotomus]
MEGPDHQISLRNRHRDRVQFTTQSASPEEDTHIHIPTGSTDVLDIAVVKNVTTPYHLETVNDLTSDHLPVIMTLSLDKNLAATTTHTTNWLEFEKQLDPRPIIIKRTSDIDDMVRQFEEDVKKAMAAATKWEKKIEELEQDQSALWKMAKALKPKSGKIPPLKSETGIINDPRDKTKEFANYFEDTFLPNKPANYGDELDPPQTTAEELLDIIKTLKNRKAPGRDGITNAAIKHLYLGAIDALRDIINGVLRYQHFPQTWKHATVIVLHKTGKPKDSTDGYRPISLLPGLSKVLEKVIQRRLLEVVSEKGILPGFQFGFRQEHSTTHQLLRITKHVTEHSDRTTPTAAVMLDIEKAFDKVWHEGLIYKLRQYKFPAALINLAQHYLKQRSFALVKPGSITKTKQHFKQWTFKGGSAPEAVGKVMAVIVLNSKKLALVEFLEKERTTMGFCCDSIRN